MQKLKFCKGLSINASFKPVFFRKPIQVFEAFMKPKIGVMHIRDSSGFYGAERVILGLANNLDQGMIDFHLLCMNRGDRKGDSLVAAARRIGIKVSVVRVNGRLDLKAIREIRKLILRRKISIIHTHDFKSDLYGLLATLGTNVKKVATAHGSTRDSFVKRLYLLLTENITYRFFDRVVAVSEDIEDKLVGLGIKPPKVVVVQNGLDYSLLREVIPDSDLCIPDCTGKKVFGIIGRIFPDKGHRFFIDAFRRIKENHEAVAALIVGEGPSLHEVELLTQSLGLDDCIHYLGFSKDINSIYEILDYLVIPSLTEGLPNVLLEAMAAGVPVLATRVGDIPLLVKQSRTGLVVPPGDVNSLFKAMNLMLLRPDFCREMAGNAKKLVEEKFSARDMALKTQKLYQNVLN